MKINPFAIAIKAKGPFDVYRRFRSITKRYGFNPGLMDQALHQFSEILHQFDCGATFPITAVTLKRHEDIITRYLCQNIEFAVHGYTHIDYSMLTQETQLAHLHLACKVFAHMGITPRGFRSPYLSRNDNLEKALLTAGFSYVSNQPTFWNVLDSSEIASTSIDSYNRSLSFYNPWQASERQSLPRFGNHLLEIPVSLPDDEILIERLGGEYGLVYKTWQKILTQTYQRGELFTLQLHPERILLCADSLRSVLAEARSFEPKVWFARLDEIAAWWKARTEANIEVFRNNFEEYHCVVNGPNGTTILARSVDVNVLSSPWKNGYVEVKATEFTFKSIILPFIGVSSSTSNGLVSFLRQQGYIVETGFNNEGFSFYFDLINFDVSQEWDIINMIEESNRPLIKLGRWPNGAQSALAITGDIDALTLWDYGFRLFGR